jgi:nucleotide-binding universal stress UspA family protein
MDETLNRVMVAIGPNDRDYIEDFIDIVGAIAKPTGAKVYLLHAFSRDEYENLMEQMEVDETSEGIQPDELASRHDTMRAPASWFEDQGIEYEVLGTIGDPASEVVGQAKELDIDMLFIGGESQSPTGKALFGDDAQQILLNAECPVTYIRRGR